MEEAPLAQTTENELNEESLLAFRLERQWTHDGGGLAGALDGAWAPPVAQVAFRARG